jgi:hypothetical protein
MCVARAQVREVPRHPVRGGRTARAAAAGWPRAALGLQATHARLLRAVRAVQRSVLPPHPQDALTS